MTWQKRAAGAGAAIFAALVIYEVLFRRPGLGSPDELGNLGWVLQMGDTWRYWLRFGAGALTRCVQGLLLAGPWPWQAIHVQPLLAALAFFAALWALGRRLGAEGAGLWAMALALSAPFSFLAARLTFSFTLVPALSILGILGLRSALGSRASFLLGLGLGLAWFDAETWVLAYPGFLAAWLSAPSEQRAKLRWVLVGGIVGLSTVLWANAPYWAEWVARRRSLFQAPQGQSYTWAGNLRSYFLGGSHPKAMGLETLAAFPLLAWPGLLLGLKAAPRWCWVWALGGLLGLAFTGPFQEPHRAIVAWPALLFISGYGYLRVHAWVLPALLIVGPLFAYPAYQRAADVWDQEAQGRSRQLQAAAVFLNAEGGALGPGFDTRDELILRRYGRLGRGPQEWYLVPAGMADPQDARWGRWKSFAAPGHPDLQLLQPSPALRPRMEAAGAQMAELRRWMVLPADERLRRLRQGPAPQEPWAWSLWAQMRMQASLHSGETTVEDIVFLSAGPNLNSQVLRSAARLPLPPGLAERLQGKAAALDPPGARWKLLHP